MEPATPKKQSDLTRDERIQACTLRDVSWKYAQIAQHLNITLRQVQYACTVGRPTPQKHRCGIKSALDDTSRQELIDFVCASAQNRQMTYQQLKSKLGWDVSGKAIRNALRKEGFLRRLARRKRPISEINRLMFQFSNLVREKIGVASSRNRTVSISCPSWRGG